MGARKQIQCGYRYASTTKQSGKYEATFFKKKSVKTVSESTITSNREFCILFIRTDDLKNNQNVYPLYTPREPQDFFFFFFSSFSRRNETIKPV